MIISAHINNLYVPVPYAGDSVVPYRLLTSSSSDPRSNISKASATICTVAERREAKAKLVLSLVDFTFLSRSLHCRPPRPSLTMKFTTKALLVVAAVAATIAPMDAFNPLTRTVGVNVATVRSFRISRNDHVFVIITFTRQKLWSRRLSNRLSRHTVHLHHLIIYSLCV